MIGDPHHPMIRPARRLTMQSPVSDEELEATYEYKPFYFEPMIAWRAWAVIEHEGQLRLRSVTYSVWWPGREELKARCIHGFCSSSPNQEHECGIYSVKNVEDAITWALHGTSSFRIIGEVKLWGRILQYEKGYIAEYAYPLRLLVPHDTSHWKGYRGELDAEPLEIARVLEEDYGVEVELGWPV